MARRQHGAISAGQLERLGLGRDVVDRWLRAGRLHRVHRGVFLVGHAAKTEHADRAAAVLVGGEETLVSHFDGGYLWDLPLAGPAAVHVTVAPGRRARHKGVVAHRAHVPSADRARRHGLPVTSAGRTVHDLAAVLTEDELEAVVADALRRRLVTGRALRERIAREPRKRGSARLRRVLDARGGPAFTRSDAERFLLSIVREARLEAPQTNFVLLGRERDAVWPQLRLVVEIDGYRWHGNRARFEDDRGRDLDLSAHGWTTVRLTVRQMKEQRVLVAARLGAALALAEQRAGATR